MDERLGSHMEFLTKVRDEHFHLIWPNSTWTRVYKQLLTSVLQQFFYKIGHSMCFPASRKKWRFELNQSTLFFCSAKPTSPGKLPFEQSVLHTRFCQWTSDLWHLVILKLISEMAVCSLRILTACLSTCLYCISLYCSESPHMASKYTESMKHLWMHLFVNIIVVFYLCGRKYYVSVIVLSCFTDILQMGGVGDGVMLINWKFTWTQSAFIDF